MTISPTIALERNYDQSMVFRSQVFEGHEQAKYAVGILAIGPEVMSGLESEFTGYAHERARRYMGEGYITESDLNYDGTELDDDDDRSVHFSVIENLGSLVRTSGTMRLIIKSTLDDRPLPVERLYPESFPQPANNGSVEDSRLTSTTRGLTNLLFAAGVSYVQRHQLGPVYGVVRPGFAEVLNRTGVPATAIGEAKYVEEIRASKLPIRVDLNGLERNIMESNEGDIFNRIRASHDRMFAFSGTI